MKIHLILLVLVFGIDTLKLNEELKKVGKRYLGKKYVDSAIQRWQFRKKTDEQVQEARDLSAQLVANHLLRQSSSQNPGYEESAKILYSLMTFDFEGGICDETMKLDYFKMVKYFKMERLFKERNDFEHLEYRMIGPNKDYTYSTFLVSFKTHNKWKYSSKPAFIVQMELRGDTEWGNYSIASIREIGTCTEKGTVHLDDVDVKLSLYDKDPEQKLTIEKITKHVERQFLNMMGGEEIQSDWFGFSASDEQFEGGVCHGDEIKTYDRQMIFNWWKKFQIMYHLAEDPKPVQVQLIGDETDNYVYRITMKTQIGTNKQDRVHSFDFKIKVTKNDDQSWWISKFEVMCGPDPNSIEEMQKIQRNAYRQILGKRIQLMKDSGDVWYLATDVFKDLLSPNPDDLEFTSCGYPKQEKSNTLEGLQHKFWENHQTFNGKIIGFDVESPNSSGIDSNGDTFSIIWIKWRRKSNEDEHESRWYFSLKWDQDLQFFHLKSIDFGCPQEGKEGSLRNYLSG